jgi:hypothetical protein
MSATVAPLTTTVMTSIDDEKHAGAASGINNAVARAAGLLAVAVLGMVAVSIFARDLDVRLANQPPEVRRAMLEQSDRLAEAQPPRGADTKVVSDAVKHSFVRAFRVTTLASAALAALSALGALFITRRT